MTTTTWGAPAAVDVPAPAPAKHTILDAVLVIDDPSGHWQMGSQYIPDVCGVSRLAASSCSALGAPVPIDDTVSANVAADRTVTVDISSVPDLQAGEVYTVYWGDGTTSTFDPPGTTITHQYPAGVATSYDIIITNDTGYRSTITVNVTTGAISGPFQGTSTTSPYKLSEDGVPVVDGYPFAAYHAATCRTVGMIGDAKARALRGLELTEHIAVGEAIESIVYDSPLFFDVTTPAQASAGMDPVDALGKVEWALGYNGQSGVILMSATVATTLIARGALAVIGGKLQTILGTPVGVEPIIMDGAGGEELPSTQTWIIGLINPVLRRGKAIVPDPAVNSATNEYLALAERPWSLTFECAANGAKAKIGYCCPSTGAAADPQSGETPLPVQSGTDSLTGPTTWTAPAIGGILRNVSITVLQGTAKINGSDVTAPTTLQFDADTGEALTPPSLELETDSDEAIVSWVQAMP